MISKLNYLLRQQMAKEENTVAQPAPNQQIASSIDSSILDSLDQWIQKIKQAFSQLAKFLGAASYTDRLSSSFGHTSVNYVHPVTHSINDADGYSQNLAIVCRLFIQLSPNHHQQ